MIEDLLETLLRAIESSRDDRRCRRMAIDGLDGAGKSTLARALRDASEGYAIVEVDDFYRVMPDHERAKLSPQQGYERNFDWQRLRDQVLEPLTASRAVRYQRYDWSQQRLDDWIDLHPQRVVLVEGCCAFRPELRGYYDLSIFVSASRCVRKERLIARGENPIVWIERWLAVGDWYLEHVHRDDDFDLVVPGD